MKTNSVKTKSKTGCHPKYPDYISLDILASVIKSGADPIEIFYAHLQCIQVVPYGIYYKVEGDQAGACNRLTGDLIHELAYDCEKNLFTVPIIGEGFTATPYWLIIDPEG